MERTGWLGLDLNFGHGKERKGKERQGREWKGMVLGKGVYCCSLLYILYISVYNSTSTSQPARRRKNSGWDGCVLVFMVLA